jgi:pimeloyl-ACP methyl ester carboxylesterase
VVLVDPAGLGQRIAWFLRLASIPGVGEYFERPSLERTRRLVRAMIYNPQLVDEDLVAEMYRYRQRPEVARGVLRLLRYGVNVFGQRPAILRADRLASISSPLLILWGRQTRLSQLSKPSTPPGGWPTQQLSSSSAAAIGPRSSTRTTSLELSPSS